MSDFLFDMDIEAELKGIRGKRQEKATAPSSGSGGAAAAPAADSLGDAHEDVMIQQAHAPVEKDNQQAVRQADEGDTKGLMVKQSYEESPGGGKAQAESAAETVNWKGFKVLPGVFEYVGGARPVRLAQNIRKSQVSGLPEPLIGVTQAVLKERHMGAVIHFPWGVHTITEKNRVFTTKSSLMRYLLFDSLRDSSGIHVQYAKQWAALHHPVFDAGFNPDVHLTPTSDELDIYALVYVSHMFDMDNESASSQIRTVDSEMEHQMMERIGLLNMNMGHVLDKLNSQSAMMQEHMARQSLMDAVLLLDRMGLLKGGLPRDVGSFVRVLEQNRSVIEQTGSVVDRHIDAENERKAFAVRQERLLKAKAAFGKK